LPVVGFKLHLHTVGKKQARENTETNKQIDRPKYLMSTTQYNVNGQFM